MTRQEAIDAIVSYVATEEEMYLSGATLDEIREKLDECHINYDEITEDEQ